MCPVCKGTKTVEVLLNDGPQTRTCFCHFEAQEEREAYVSTWLQDVEPLLLKLGLVLRPLPTTGW